jgi:hypothetical protein
MANEQAATPQWQMLQTLTNPALQIVGVGGTPSQSITATLALSLLLYSYRENNKPGTIKQKFLKVSLAGSRVAPNTPKSPSDYVRGYFTESVDIDIGFDDPRGIQLREKSPSSTALAGSLSSSVSESLSVGFFGETPTANVGGSISESFSISIPDFEFHDRDDANKTQPRLHHLMSLKLLEGIGGAAGARYENPTSLIRDSSGVLHRPPPLATDNLPLPSLALFHANMGLDEPRNLRIRIDHRVIRVQSSRLMAAGEIAPAASPLVAWLGEKIDGLLSGVQPKKPAAVGRVIQNLPPYDENKRDQNQHVAVNRVNLEIDPKLCRSEWSFVIPFDKV